MESELSIGFDTVTAHRQAVERVILRMRARLADPFSLTEMARTACISPFHFDRIFHQTTGIPAVQFLYALRIEAAKRLLLTTFLSVTDICYEVGYNSIGTFTSRFTQLVGLSPRQFQRLSERVSNTCFESLFNDAVAILKNLPTGPLVSGHIITSDSSSRLIFVGLFPTQIPKSRPIAGTLLSLPGVFGIAAQFTRPCYVFAAAFPRTKDALSYLLPEPASLLVGAGLRPVSLTGQQHSDSTDIILRQLRLTDPPILVALPVLLVEAVGEDKAMVV